MEITTPAVITNLSFGNSLKINDKDCCSSSAAITFAASQKRNFEYLLFEAGKVSDDAIALRLIITRICSNFATALLANHPKSVHDLLKREFVKLKSAYLQLENSESPRIAPEVKNNVLQSLQSVLALMNRLDY